MAMKKGETGWCSIVWCWCWLVGVERLKEMEDWRKMGWITEPVATHDWSDVVGN